jgi:hypothetical protein
MSAGESTATAAVILVELALFLAIAAMWMEILI